MANTNENPVDFYNFRSILTWYEAMGVDTAISETSIDWLESGQKIDQSWVNFKAHSQQTSPQTQKQSHGRSFQQQDPGQQQDQSQQQNPGQQPDRGHQQNPAYQQTLHTPKDKATSPAADFLKTQRSETGFQSKKAPQTTAPLSLPSLERAKKIAKDCNSIEQLKAALEEFDGCGLKRTAKNLVFAKGADTAPLMIIGEAPGREEDIVGKPFVGETGTLLDNMLKAINLDEHQCHITNLVYWRPPGNRIPTQEETSLCRPFLDRQIELVGPKVILILGGTTAKHLYNTTTGITKLRGKWQNLANSHHTMPTLATLHPADLLRTPIAKRLAWKDLQMIRDKLQQLT